MSVRVLECITIDTFLIRLVPCVLFHVKTVRFVHIRQASSVGVFDTCMTSLIAVLSHFHPFTDERSARSRQCPIFFRPAVTCSHPSVALLHMQ